MGKGGGGGSPKGVDVGWGGGGSWLGVGCVKVSATSWRANGSVGGGYIWKAVHEKMAGMIGGGGGWGRWGVWRVLYAGR